MTAIMLKPICTNYKNDNLIARIAPRIMIMIMSVIMINTIVITITKNTVIRIMLIVTIIISIFVTSRARIMLIMITAITRITDDNCDFRILIIAKRMI